MGWQRRRGARGDARGRLPLSPALVAGILVLALFLALEVLERTWLQNAGGELLTLLHQVRGAVAALVAGGVALWLILSEGPPLLAAGPLPRELPEHGRLDARQQRAHYARWFILMRWIAVVVAALTVLLGVGLAQVLPRYLVPGLSAVIAVLTLLNLGYMAHLQRRGASTAFLVVQTYVDVVLLVVLLHLSGGIENPLTPVLLLHVIIAGIVLGRRHSYRVAGVGSVLFALVAWGEWSGVLPHYTLSVFPHIDSQGHIHHAAHDTLYAASRVILQAVILFLVAYFTTTLLERIREDERQLESLADRALTQAQTLERALDTTGTALCICDSALRPSWVNARWTEWLGAQHPHSDTSAGSPAARTLKDGAVRTAELRLPAAAPGAPGAGQVERIFHMTTAPLRDRGGEIRQVVTLAHDVTALHEAQARAVRAERLAAVGELAGQIAHEVNNPIAIISGKARLLLRERDDALPEKPAQEVAKIAELSDRVARIAQGLLSYCHPAPGARGRLDLRLPLRRALAYVEARAAASGIRLRDELPDTLPQVEANASELEQVFLNIFLNSLDAMPDGGELRVRAIPSTGAVGDCWVRIEIGDSGPGIAPELRERVFEPFLTTKGGRGTGLGLSICQGLIRSHGGSIAIDDEPGGGALVRIRLPAAPSRQAPRPSAPPEEAMRA